jgi:hypothetical protein
MILLICTSTTVFVLAAAADDQQYHPNEESTGAIMMHVSSSSSNGAAASTTTLYHFPTTTRATAEAAATQEGFDMDTFMKEGNTSSTATATAEGAAEEEEHTEEEEEEHTEDHPYYAVLLPWFSTALGIGVFYLQSRHFHLVPYTCVMFIIGLCMGVGAVRSGFDDQLTESIAQWTNIHHETLFVVFLPGLLMKDALEVNAVYDMI